MTTSTIKAGNLEGTAYTLVNDDARIEVWPFFGFNCVRWQHQHRGQWIDVLFQMPDLMTNPVPTRNGHPVLFPFPNRMRNGRFHFEGKEYQLPLTDNSGQHAIHGFTPRLPWRVLEHSDASITGEFRLSVDASQFADCWPADARLRLTYRIAGKSLFVDAVIDAADGRPLPFGLGYHPYFTLGGNLADWQLQCPVGALWEQAENLPTGQKLALDGDYDFRRARPLGATMLDHAYGEISTTEPQARIATLTNGNRLLTIDVDPAFQELLLFIPVHRQAVAIEPYTCRTDAANLESKGIAAGWRTLAPGEIFRAVVEYRHTFQPA